MRQAERRGRGHVHHPVHAGIANACYPKARTAATPKPMRGARCMRPSTSAIGQHEGSHLPSFLIRAQRVHGAEKSFLDGGASLPEPASDPSYSEEAARAQVEPQFALLRYRAKRGVRPGPGALRALRYQHGAHSRCDPLPADARRRRSALAQAPEERGVLRGSAAKTRRTQRSRAKRSVHFVA